MKPLLAGLWWVFLTSLLPQTLLLHQRDMQGMSSLVFGGWFVIHDLTLGDFLWLFPDHVCAVEKQILSAVIRGDEAKAFSVAKPFYDSLCQWWSPCKASVIMKQSQVE